MIPRWQGKVARTAVRAAGPFGRDADGAVVHVGTVWSAAMMAVGAHADLEFGERLAKHVGMCGTCEERVVLAVWSAVLRYVGISDVVRAIEHERKGRS